MANEQIAKELSEISLLIEQGKIAIVRSYQASSMVGSKEEDLLTLRIKGLEYLSEARKRVVALAQHFEPSLQAKASQKAERIMDKEEEGRAE